MLNLASTSNVETRQLLIEQLELDRFTPRKRYGDRYVNELAESIENVGQLKPIVVRPHPSMEDVYEVIDGVHRVQALKKLGRVYVRAEIHHLNDEEADFLAMKINQMHGKRLDELEEGLHVMKILETYNWTQEELAGKLGHSQQWVSQRLKLARDSCDELIDAFTTRVVNPTIAREITELPKRDQPEVLVKVSRDSLSSRETALLIRTLKERPDEKEIILSRPIVELMPPPKDIIDYEAQYGLKRPKFETVDCPYCREKLLVNWVLRRINSSGDTR